jgi:hypothetical protein
MQAVKIAISTEQGVMGGLYITSIEPTSEPVEFESVEACKADYAACGVKLYAWGRCPGFATSESVA